MAYYKYKSLKLSNEDKLLLLCARMPIKNKIKEEITSLVRQDVDWDYLLNISAKHGLKPLLHWQLLNICPDEISSDIMLNLKEFLKKNASKNLVFMKEILEIFKILNQHHFKSIPYKGPILAQQVYGNLTMRQFDDIDLLVRKDDVLYIKQILISKGYKPEFNLNPVQEQNYIKSQRELKFFNKDKGITLELHWKFSGVFLNLPSNAEKIFLKDLNSWNIAGVSIPEISPENLILILSIHNASHQWNRLAWLVDIATLVNNQEIDWSKVLKISEKLSIQKILFINLHLCQRLFNLKMGTDISRYLNDNSVTKTSNIFAENIFLVKSENSLIENIQISMKIRENKIDGIKDCFSGIFNPSFYELNQLALPSSLFFLYYIYRPLNLLKRYKLFK